MPQNVFQSFNSFKKKPTKLRSYWTSYFIIGSEEKQRDLHTKQIRLRQKKKMKISLLCNLLWPTSSFGHQFAVCGGWIEIYRNDWKLTKLDRNLGHMQWSVEYSKSYHRENLAVTFLKSYSSIYNSKHVIWVLLLLVKFHECVVSTERANKKVKHTCTNFHQCLTLIVRVWFLHI